MYDEIIKRHRYSSSDWFSDIGNRNLTISYHNPLEVIKLFTEYRYVHNYLHRQDRSIRSIEDLEFIELLDVMINNVEFQKEVFYQIDPPFDVLSKV